MNFSLVWRQGRYVDGAAPHHIQQFFESSFHCIQLPCVVVKPCPGGQAELRIFRSHQLLDLGAANFAPPNGLEHVIGDSLRLQRKPAQFRG